MIEEGKKAPNFPLPATNGGKIKLSELQGSPVVLYFYPKDATPGCTTEACDFRDYHGDFEKLGVKVLGMSADPMKAHEKFSEKHELPFPLVSDEEKKTLEKYGVWQEKKMYGKTFMGIVRSTVIIDENGKVVKVWPKVKVKGHVEEVLDVVRNLVSAG